MNLLSFICLTIPINHILLTNTTNEYIELKSLFVVSTPDDKDIRNVVCNKKHQQNEEQTFFLTQIRATANPWGLSLRSTPLYATTNNYHMDPTFISDNTFQTGVTYGSSQIDGASYLDADHKVYCDGDSNVVVFEYPEAPFFLRVSVDDNSTVHPALYQADEYFRENNGTLHRCNLEGKCVVVANEDSLPVGSLQIFGDNLAGTGAHEVLDFCSLFDSYLVIRPLYSGPPYSCYLLDTEEEYAWFYGKEAILLEFMNRHNSQFRMRSRVEIDYQ